MSAPVKCSECNDTYEVNLKPCQECCDHDFDPGEGWMCMNCEFQGQYGDK